MLDLNADQNSHQEGGIWKSPDMALTKWGITWGIGEIHELCWEVMARHGYGWCWKCLENWGPASQLKFQRKRQVIDRERERERYSYYFVAPEFLSFFLTCVVQIRLAFPKRWHEKHPIHTAHTTFGQLQLDLLSFLLCVTQGAHCLSIPSLQ